MTSWAGTMHLEGITKGGGHHEIGPVALRSSLSSWALSPPPQGRLVSAARSRSPVTDSTSEAHLDRLRSWATGPPVPAPETIRCRRCGYEEEFSSPLSGIDDGGNAIERFMARHDCAARVGWKSEVDETD